MAEVTNDNGGRRLEPDRRQFAYSEYVPDLRSGHERRSGVDRRQSQDVDRRRSRRTVKININ